MTNEEKKIFAWLEKVKAFVHDIDDQMFACDVERGLSKLFGNHYVSGNASTESYSVCFRLPEDGDILLIVSGFFGDGELATTKWGNDRPVRTLHHDAKSELTWVAQLMARRGQVIDDAMKTALRG